MWRSIRALLITIVLVFVCLEALPLPSMKKRHLNHRIAQEEIDRWQGLLGDVGIEIERQALIDLTFSASRWSNKARRGLIRPFRLLERKLGLGQRWGLFTYVDPYPGRLVVEGTRGGNAWETLYRDPHDDGSHLASILRHRRMRGVWDDTGDRPHPGTLYGRWVTWLARRLFEQDPALQAIRVRFDRLTIRLPGGKTLKAPKPKPVHVRERQREDVL